MPHTFTNTHEEPPFPDEEPWVGRCFHCRAWADECVCDGGWDSQPIAPTHRYVALPAGRTKREPVEEARRALFWVPVMDDLRPARGIGAAVAVSVGVMIVLWLLF